jgi:hypothetical protein
MVPTTAQAGRQRSTTSAANSLRYQGTQGNQPGSRDRAGRQYAEWSRREVGLGGDAKKVRGRLDFLVDVVARHAPKQQVRAPALLESEGLRLCFYFLRRVAQPGSVDNVDGHTFDDDGLFKIVARRPRLRTDERASSADEHIEQAALARVRLACQNDAKWPLTQAALVELFAKIRQVREASAKSQKQIIASNEPEVLVGEVESGFDVGEKIQKVIAQQLQRPSHAAGKLGERLG